MNKVRVAVTFSRLESNLLATFASGVITRMTGNAAYPNPEVPLPDLFAANETFRDALAGKVQGGTRATAWKNQCREALIQLLRREATYVQIACNNDLPTMLSSGFKAVSMNRAPTPLETPQILKIVNERSGELMLMVTPIRNARSYSLETSEDGVNWQQAIIFCNTRRVILAGLTPGHVYWMRVRAIGGSTRYSDWSDIQQRRSM